MSDWTDDEMSEFTVLVDKASSLRQMDRIESRIAMPKFIEKHGREKCDRMFAFMTAADK